MVEGWGKGGRTSGREYRRLGRGRRWIGLEGGDGVVETGAEERYRGLPILLTWEMVSDDRYHEICVPSCPFSCLLGGWEGG